ncbi:hypothetical protein ACA910_016241 [Epithemia clementina (nom. ined.)]
MPAKNDGNALVNSRQQPQRRSSPRLASQVGTKSTSSVIKLPNTNKTLSVKGNSRNKVTPDTKDHKRQTSNRITPQAMLQNGRDKGEHDNDNDNDMMQGHLKEEHHNDTDDDDNDNNDVDDDSDHDDHVYEPNQTYEFEGVVYDSYQEMVNAKRRRNQDLLVRSGLLDVSLSLSSSSKKRKLAADSRKKKTTKSQQLLHSSRKSRRLQGEEAEGIFIQDERGGRFSVGNSTLKSSSHSNYQETKGASPQQQVFFGNRINDGSDMTLAQAVQAIGEKWYDDGDNDGKVPVAHAQALFRLIRAQQQKRTWKITEDRTSPKPVRSPSRDTTLGGMCKDSEETEARPIKEVCDDGDKEAPSVSTMITSASLLLESHIERLSVGGASLGSSQAEGATTKLVPDRVYSITTHPSLDQLLVCAGDKQGYVGIWNATSRESRHEAESSDMEQHASTTISSDNSNPLTKQCSTENATNNPTKKVHMLRFHTRPVTSMAWINGGDSMLTTSYDSTCRLWNAETETFTQVFAAYNEDPQFAHHPGHGLYKEEEEDGLWFQSACVDHRSSTNSSAVFLSTSAGTVLHVDWRDRTKVTWNEQLSEKKINSVSLHPNGNSFISSGLDCCVRLWDLRMFGGHKTKRKGAPSTATAIPLAEYNGIKSINSAYFSTVTGQHVLVTTMNNRLDVLHNFHLASSSTYTNTAPTKQKSQKSCLVDHNNYVIQRFPHDNITGRWLCTFMARWHPSVDDLFCVGSMEKPRNVHVYNTKRQLAAVPGLTAVVSRCCFHPSTQELILVGGNSSGRVTIVREQREQQD